MQIKSKWIATAVLSLLSGVAEANEWVHDVEVIKIGTYQAVSSHFVWISTLPGECNQTVSNNPVLSFSDDLPGGKALLATLMTALVSRRKLDVQVKGCQIVEVYLK